MGGSNCHRSGVLPLMRLMLCAIAVGGALHGCSEDIQGEPTIPTPPRAYLQPFTPCCQLERQSSSPMDPDLPVDGAGPFTSFSIEKIFFDQQRNRTIRADIEMPSEDGLTVAVSWAPYPAILVVHGFSGSKELMRGYAQRLASWGYVAISPQLPYSGIVDVLFNVKKFSHRESAIDLLFILNSLCCESNDPSSILYRRIDTSRLAAAGHSMGGKLCVLASLFDDSLRAIVGIDPVDGAGPQLPPPFEDLFKGPEFPDLAPEQLPGLKVPTLYLGGTEGKKKRLGQACAPEDQNYHQFWLYSPSPSVEITFVGADHTDFLEHSLLFDLLDPCNLGTADYRKVRSLSFKYTIAFFNHVMRG